MIRYSCPHCKKINEAADGAGGSIASCAGCNQRLRVPQPPAPPPVVPPPSPPAPVQEEVPVVYPIAGGGLGAPLVFEEVVPEIVEEVVPEIVSENIPLVTPVVIDPSPGKQPRTPSNPDALRKKLPADLPPEVGALGEPIAFIDNHTNATMAFVVAGLFLAGLGYFGLFAVKVVSFRSGDRDFLSAFLGLVGVAFALSIAAGLGGLFGFLELKTWTMVYRGGFLRSVWGKLRVWRWEDVAAVRIARTDTRTVNSWGAEISRVFREVYTLRRHGGDFYTFAQSGSRFARHPLGEIVVRETFQRMLPAAAAQMQNGGTVDFAPFQVSGTGLAYEHKSAAWAEVTGFAVRNGRLSIEVAGSYGRWAEVPLALVDNYHVFLPILEKITGVRP